MNTNNIQEHMEVVGSDGNHVGTVDRVEGERLKLTKSDPAADGEHHYIGLDQVERVEDGKVCLRLAADDARSSWQ